MRALKLRGLRWAAVLLALLALPAGRGAAQAAPLNMTVAAGFDGAYHRAAWFPVMVNLSNDGPDISGVLEWRYPVQPNEGTFQTPVELPRGARKQIRMNVLTRNFVRNGELRLLSDGQELLSQSVQLDGLDQDTFLVGVISSDPALLNSLDALQNPATGVHVSVRHFGASLLPDQPEALNGLNALFLHDLDSAALSPGQRRTLELWVQQGGQLVVSGGLNAERAAALADLLPVELAGTISQADLGPLARSAALIPLPLTATPLIPSVAPSETPTPTPLGTAVPLGGTPTSAPALAPTSAPADGLQLSGAVADVRLRPGAEVIAGGNSPLMVRQQIGAGQVIFCTFDIAGLAGWRGDLALWARTIDIHALANLVSQAHNTSYGGILEVLRFGVSDLPSAGALLLVLFVYVLATGPLTYLVLRRLRRIDWAWVTLPLTMLGFAALFYLAGFGLRSGRTPISQLALVQSVEGRPSSVVSTFVRLYSSNRSRYTVGLPPDTLASEMIFWYRSSSNAVSVLNGPQQVELQDLVVDVGSVRTIAVQSALHNALPVTSALNESGNTVQGSLTYTGAEPLEDALVVRGNSYDLLGSLAPGQQHQIKLDQIGLPPANYQLSETGSIDRRRLVTLLFNDLISQLNRDDATYLLAWRVQPALPVQLNGQPADQEGVTLYIVQLKR
jgi:hypothetical protein